VLQFAPARKALHIHKFSFQRLSFRRVDAQNLLKIGVGRTELPFQGTARSFEVCRIDPHQHPHRGFIDAAIFLAHQFHPVRDALLIARGTVGEQVICHRIIRMDAEHVVEQIDRNAGTVLPGCAMYQACAPGLRQGGKITPEDIVEPFSLGQGTIQLDHRAVRAGGIDASRGSLEMRRKTRGFAFEVKHFSRETGWAAAGFLRPLAIAAKVYHMLQVKPGDRGEIAFVCIGMMAGTEQLAGLHMASARNCIAAIIAEIVNRSGGKETIPNHAGWRGRACTLFQAAKPMLFRRKQSRFAGFATPRRVKGM